MVARAGGGGGPDTIPAGACVAHDLSLNLCDYLPAEIAVADSRGAVVKVNRKWKETARHGDLSVKPGGWNYIAEWEAAIGRGCGEAADILQGLRDVLCGVLPTFLSIYSCPFDGRHRWYQIAVAPLDVGGDEFGVVFPIGDDALAARRVRAHFQSPAGFPISDAHNSVFVSASVGVALYPDDGTAADVLIQAADRAMYAQKRGRSVA